MSRWWEYQNSHAQKIALKIFLLHTGVCHDVNASLNELDTYCFFHTFFLRGCSSFIIFRKALA